MQKIIKNPYLLALRPHQWTKNLIVFAAPLFAFSINLATLLASLIAFILFCCISSSFYLFNDIIDVESDRRHPIKCKRPIAAGLVKMPIAMVMAVFLLVTSLMIGWVYSSPLGTTITGYTFLQVAYNIKLKKTVILDIGAIATGFVLRANAGAVATAIVLSPWFVLCTAMLALFLAVEKRKAELRLTKIQDVKPRSVLKQYSLSLLSRIENTATTGTVISYALWSSGPQVQGASTSWMLITLPFVLYGIFRYQFLSDPQALSNSSDYHSNSNIRSERPEEILLKDLPILTTIIIWIMVVLTVLFLKNQGLIQ